MFRKKASKSGKRSKRFKIRNKILHYKIIKKRDMAIIRQYL